MSGASDVTTELAPEISAILTLEQERAEWEFLKGQRLMSCPAVIPGAALLVSAHRLRNPAASGVVAVISSIHIAQTGGAAEVIRLTRAAESADLASLTPTVARDTRYPGINQSALIASAGNPEIFAGDVWHVSVSLTGDTKNIYVPFVLTPGNQIDATTNSDNFSLEITWHWLEKRLDQLQIQ